MSLGLSRNQMEPVPRGSVLRVPMDFDVDPRGGGPPDHFFLEFGLNQELRGVFDDQRSPWRQVYDGLAAIGAQHVLSTSIAWKRS